MEDGRLMIKRRCYVIPILLFFAIGSYGGTLNPSFGDWGSVHDVAQAFAVSNGVSMTDCPGRTDCWATSAGRPVMEYDDGYYYQFEVDTQVRATIGSGSLTIFAEGRGLGSASCVAVCDAPPPAIGRDGWASFGDDFFV